MTTEHREFDSLNEALRIQRIPFENHQMIHRIVSNIAIARYEASGAHIRAIRSAGGHDLLIKSGYTTGFSSKEEGAAASGGSCFANSTTGNWLVEHPRNSLRQGNGPRSGVSKRRAQVCPDCTMEISSSGTCGCP